MATNPKEPNPLSQSEIIQNFELTAELFAQLIDKLSQENASQSSINNLKLCLQRLKFDISDNNFDQIMIKEVLFEELDKITVEMTGNTWDKNHKFNNQLTIEQLFDRLKTLQCGRKINIQRKLNQLSNQNSI